MVDEAFDRHFERTPSHPDEDEYMMLEDNESGYSWDRRGEPVVIAVQEAAGISAFIAEDVVSILAERHASLDSDEIGGEAEFDSESYYEQRPVDDVKWRDEWRRFDRELRAETRFFSSTAQQYLSSIFSDVRALIQSNGKSVIVPAGPGTQYTKLERARVFQSGRKLREAFEDLAGELGPPPATFSMAGRMNARGISVFYGATCGLLALAEVRPPVGSTVLLGSFDIVRPLELLDLAALARVDPVGSIFDPTYATKLEKAEFLRTMHDLITRPVMPDDEALDYLPTQAIADYLATDKDISVDGMIYRSAQVPGEEMNVVLFHKASRVGCLAAPGSKQTLINEWDEETSDDEFTVVEFVPQRSQAHDDPRLAMLAEAIEHAETFDPSRREITLRLDKRSVRVERVTAVEFLTQTKRVRYVQDENDRFDIEF